MLNKLNNQNGVGLLELLIVAGIMAVTVLGMLQLFVFTSTGASLAGNKTIAVMEAQSKIEEIRAYDFDSIVTDYANGGTVGNTFALSSINGMGVVYIDNSNPDLLTVEVVVSWEDKYDRIVGEDKNLDGTLAFAEDVNGNLKIDSPVELVTQLGDR